MRANPGPLTIDEARYLIGTIAIALADAIGDQPGPLSQLLSGHGSVRGLPIPAANAARAYRAALGHVKRVGLGWVVADQVEGGAGKSRGYVKCPGTGPHCRTPSVAAQGPGVPRAADLRGPLRPGADDPTLWPPGYAVRFHPTELIGPGGGIEGRVGEELYFNATLVAFREGSRGLSGPARCGVVVSKVVLLCSPATESDKHCGRSKLPPVRSSYSFWTGRGSHTGQGGVEARVLNQAGTYATSALLVLGHASSATVGSLHTIIPFLK